MSLFKPISTTTLKRSIETNRINISDYNINFDGYNQFTKYFDSFYVLKELLNEQIINCCANTSNYLENSPYSKNEIHKTIHPDDIFYVKKACRAMFYTALKNLKHTTNTKIHFNLHYRILNRQGDYVPIQEQFVPIQVLYKPNEIIGISQIVVLDETYYNGVTATVKFLKNNSKNEIFHKNYTADILKEKLTKRELQILKLLNKNLSSKAIANDLNISTLTVEVHRRNIIKKLNFKNTSEIKQFCTLNKIY